LERDWDGCPKIINLGSLRTDLFYEKRLGQTGLCLRERDERRLQRFVLI
jgi:hypothetical protein